MISFTLRQSKRIAELARLKALDLQLMFGKAVSRLIAKPSLAFGEWLGPALVEELLQPKSSNKNWNRDYLGDIERL